MSQQIQHDTPPYSCAIIAFCDQVVNARKATCPENKVKISRRLGKTRAWRLIFTMGIDARRRRLTQAHEPNLQICSSRLQTFYPVSTQLPHLRGQKHKNEVALLCGKGYNESLYVP
ncbi:MAG: hypothetical protein RR843_03530 [Clostridia bacterium]